MATVVVSPAGSSYQKECVLGSGAFGTILKCKHGDQLESTCVIKRVKLARQTPQERFASVQELAILQQLRHRNLVHGIDGWIESKHTACLVMDYCSGGTLATLLRSRKGEALLENDVCMILVQLASVVAYLHGNGIIHRDIKTYNIMLGDNGLLKLGDLGMCRHLSNPSDRPRTTAGTLNYMSPELTREDSYSTPTDIWGLGCVMFEVCSLRPAFYAFNSAALIKKIGSGKAPLVPKKYSQPLRELLRSMFYQDEARRPTAEEILASPCLQEARQRVEAMFGGCHGDDSHGPVYSLADVDPPLLSLMIRFRSESGSELHLPEALAQGYEEAPDVDETSEAAPAVSVSGAMDVDVFERGHGNESSSPGVVSAGRLHAICATNDRQHSFGDRRETGSQEQQVLQHSSAATFASDKPGCRAGFMKSGSRFARVKPNVARGSDSTSTGGHGGSGAATRMRAAARQSRYQDSAG